MSRTILEDVAKTTVLLQHDNLVPFVLADDGACDTLQSVSPLAASCKDNSGKATHVMIAPILKVPCHVWLFTGWW
jgi:hypothetical protein